MESMSAISEGEWSSLCGMFTTEEADFMAQFLGNIPNELSDSSTLWTGHETTMNMAGVDGGSYYNSSDIVNTNSYFLSQGNRFSQQNYYMSDSHPILITNDSSMTMDFCVGDAKNAHSYLIEAGDDCLNQESSDGNVEESGMNQPEAVLSAKNLQLKRGSNDQLPVPEPEPEPAAEDKNNNNPSENSKKRSRSSVDVQKNKRNAKSRKNQKLVSANNNEEDVNAGPNGQSSSSCCSEDDSNGSQELNGGATSSVSSKGAATLNSSGKTRASRGSATDPQSLYARKRRERINERLRILQNLVPNGTKVDISTMLEEAVQYVKFLQLQIKLLSSDDLWMYAPLAYNGMDIGIDMKITIPR